MQTYILVHPGADQGALDDNINASLIENIRPQPEEFMGISPEEFAEAGGKYGVFTQALTEIHLDADIEVAGDVCYRPIGNRTYLVIFGVIACFVLVIASINLSRLPKRSFTVCSRLSMMSSLRFDWD